jgi:hypothetical protein
VVAGRDQGSKTGAVREFGVTQIDEHHSTGLSQIGERLRQPRSGGAVELSEYCHHCETVALASNHIDASPKWQDTPPG